LETALLGAHEKGTMLSDLIDRFDPSKAPPWPQLEGTLTADSLVLGPIDLQHLSAAVQILPASAQITSLDAIVFGGSVSATGSLLKPATIQDKPDYTFEGDFQRLNVADVGHVLGLRWTGQPLGGHGKVELSGYTDRDLAASAKGTLHFETSNGSIAAVVQPAFPKNAAGDAPEAALVPAALTRFDDLTADATIADGAITLGQTRVTSGAKKQSVEASITFGEPPKVIFPAPPAPKETRMKKR
jgi:hypothetical protein